MGEEWEFGRGVESNRAETEVGGCLKVPYEDNWTIGKLPSSDASAGKVASLASIRAISELEPQRVKGINILAVAPPLQRTLLASHRQISLLYRAGSDVLISH